jgi:hypothetical protein
MYYRTMQITDAHIRPHTLVTNICHTIVRPFAPAETRRRLQPDPSSYDGAHPSGDPRPVSQRGEDPCGVNGRLGEVAREGRDHYGSWTGASHRRECDSVGSVYVYTPAERIQTGAARLFAREGAKHIYLLDYNPAPLSRLAEELRKKYPNTKASPSSMRHFEING